MAPRKVLTVAPQNPDECRQETVTRRRRGGAVVATRGRGRGNRGAANQGPVNQNNLNGFVREDSQTPSPILPPRRRPYNARARRHVSLPATSTPTNTSMSSAESTTSVSITDWTRRSNPSSGSASSSNDESRHPLLGMSTPSYNLRGRYSSKSCRFGDHKLQIPKAPFQRLVRETFQDFIVGEHRFQPQTFDALQEATENYMANIFGLTGAIAKHAGRKTIMEKDLKFACEIDNSMGGGKQQ